MRHISSHFTRFTFTLLLIISRVRYAMLQTITVTLDHVKLETRDSGRRCWDYVAVHDGLTIHDILIHKCIANGIQV